jgi:hypothetical protein
MRSLPHTSLGRLGIAILTAATVLLSAQVALAIDLPPGRTVPSHAASPVTFRGTDLGAGLKKGQRIPATATVRKQVFAHWKDGDGAAVNTTAPKGRAVVAVTGQIVTRSGKVVRSFYGQTGKAVVVIEGQITPTTGPHPGVGDAGSVTEFPASLKPPAGSSYVVWTLFRKGADPNSGQ